MVLCVGGQEKEEDQKRVLGGHKVVGKAGDEIKLLSSLQRIRQDRFTSGNAIQT
jgi:hypothetical protein